VQLRRENQPSGNGRVYTVGLKVTNAGGLTTVGSYRIHILRAGGAVDDGPVQTVMGPCHPGHVAGPLNPFNPSPPIPPLARPDNDLSLAAPWGSGETEGRNPRPSHSLDRQSGRFVVEESPLWLRGPRMDLFWSTRYTSGLGQKTALGPGWNHCWNIFLEKGSGTELKLSDDTGRQSLYTSRKGIYTSPELFTEGQFNPLGEFILKFPQTGLWVFHALDGSPKGGKLKSVTNRNGTTTTLIYNEWGQLVRIEGPFHRTLTLAYNVEDLIASVTDSSGRSVRYQYYGPGEAGGNEGDLKSVRTPIVVGTQRQRLPGRQNHNLHLHHRFPGRGAQPPTVDHHRPLGPDVAGEHLVTHRQPKRPHLQSCDPAAGGGRRPDDHLPLRRSHAPRQQQPGRASGH
jgi:YD repeat-containing protein